VTGQRSNQLNYVPYLIDRKSTEANSCRVPQMEALPGHLYMSRG
jgi:hypothetical protein